jgi:dihydrofolate reductase
MDGIESALERAVAAADGTDVTIGGGASTAQLTGRPAHEFRTSL